MDKTSTKFYQEDTVRHRDSPTSLGIVLRCWHDAEDLPPIPGAVDLDPLSRPLKKGEVGVSFLPSHVRDILPESAFDLVDRVFQPGDVCKRSIDDVHSGVITSVEVEGLVEHAISGAAVEGWKSAADLRSPIDVDVGDYVAYDDWIGQVQEMFDEAIVELANGTLVRLPELSAHLQVGDKGNDIMPNQLQMNGMQSILGFFRRGQAAADMVVAVQHTVLAVSWLAINQSLSSSETQERQRPPQFWFGENLSKLTLVRSRADQLMRVGDKIFLKDNPQNIVNTRHGREGDPIPPVEVDTFVVKQTQTTVKVLWQDGSEEVVKATELIPYLNPDEYDCWPGDHVLWKSEDQKRTAVVQTLDSAERVARVRFTDTDSDEVELVPVLELDPHGTGEWMSPSAAPEGLGVRRGDLVFIHPEGTTNGAEKPRVPRIGEIEAWVREIPSFEESGAVLGWRRYMSDIGIGIAQCSSKGEHVQGIIQRPLQGSPSVDWFGEVTNLRLDGSVEVSLADASVRTVPIERLTKLYDGGEQLEDWADELSEDHSEGSYMDEDGVEIKYEDGSWEVHPGDGDDDEWEEEEPMDIEEGDWPEQSPIPSAEVTESRPSGLETPPAQSEADRITPTLSSAQLSSPGVPMTVTEDKDRSEEDPPLWKRFEILPEAPHDHAFYGSTPGQQSRQFLSRLAKEYRALTSSLPESILVRAFEDRTDLLRCLIMGPENTPYEDAPFVIDWMLDSNFPQSPPIAHFLSWTNGNGRVNPNLYEEGKVCLSILGTWAGDRSESWSAARSSLLQAFVSIQGLVLVKEPWFCEPAYDKLRGTEEGIVNSRLYNEKAYVLSRGFVRRALEIPLGGLELEIYWMYYTNGRLEKVVRDAHALVEKSKALPADAEPEREVAVPRLTAGGVITLTRTLNKLQALLDAHQVDAPQ